MIKIEVYLGRTENHCFKYDPGCLLCHLGEEGLMHSLILDEVPVHPAKFSMGDRTEDHFICQDHLEQARKEQEFEVVETEDPRINRYWFLAGIGLDEDEKDKVKTLNVDTAYALYQMIKTNREDFTNRFGEDVTNILQDNLGNYGKDSI